MTTVIFSQNFSSGQKLELVQGDLTNQQVDAIVNAANQYLAHGGGVAGAIASKGGPIIQQESEAWIRDHGLVSHSAPAYTGAGRLPSKYVIHAVGPRWGDGDEDRKLAAAITGSLALADKLGLASLAMPPISTGIFGFPKERAASIFKDTISDYFLNYPQSGLKLVRMTIFDRETLQILRLPGKINHRQPHPDKMIRYPITFIPNICDHPKVGRSIFSEEN